MKTRSILLIFVLLSMLWIASCAAPAVQPAVTQAPPTQPPSTPVPPAQTPAINENPPGEDNTGVVIKMVERLNAGDVEGSLVYFADDAMVYLMGLPPTGIEIYTGKEQIRSLWQASVDNHFKWEVEVNFATGDLVNVRAKTWHDFTRQLQVAPLEYTDVYQVTDGKIKAYGSWLTEEALARFKPAFAAAVPPEPTATPFSGTPGSDLMVTIAGGSCTAEAPPALKAGEVKVKWNVQDQDKRKYGLTLFTLDPGKDLLDLMVTTVGQPPSWGKMLMLVELNPGESKTYTVRLEEGPLYLICWSQPPDLPIGNAGPIPVVP